MSKPQCAAFICALALALICGCARSDSPDRPTVPHSIDPPEVSPLPPVVSIPDEVPEEDPLPGDLIDPLEEAQRVAAEDLPENLLVPEAPAVTASSESDTPDQGEPSREVEPNREGRLQSAAPAAVPEAPASPEPEPAERLEQLPAAAAATAFVFTDIEAELLQLINTERQNNDLPLLEMDSAMQFAAQTRAEEALESLSHTRPDGTPYHTAFDDAGFPYAGKWHGENLAVIRVGSGDFSEADIAGALFAQWQSSAGHHQNMLGENFSQTGIGVHLLRDNNTIAIGAAQLFASL